MQSRAAAAGQPAGASGTRNLWPGVEVTVTVTGEAEEDTSRSARHADASAAVSCSCSPLRSVRQTSVTPHTHLLPAIANLG